MCIGFFRVVLRRPVQRPYVRGADDLPPEALLALRQVACVENFAPRLEGVRYVYTCFG